MSTIKPLATIAVLAAVGAFLARQITEGPSISLDDQWVDQSEAPAAEWPKSGVETSPLAAEEATDSIAPSSLAARTAPAWDAGLAQTKENEPIDPLVTLPAQPVQESMAAVGSGGANTDNLSLAPLPVQQSPAVSGRVPSLGSSTSDLENTAASDAVSQASATSMLPGMPTDAGPEAGFEAAWLSIEAALHNDQLANAHRMLSQWVDDPSLTPAKKQEVEQLLGQLAGTIVYSMEHRLEPPHVVEPGETLATIAEEYEVPWQLLAKINGVATAEGIRAGQTLKVLRGPFDAKVDLTHGELTVLLDDRYAGKFPIRVSGAVPSQGLWQVDQKQMTPGPSSDRRIVLSGASGEEIELSTSPSPTPGSQLAVASRDLEDLFDILSVGSSVTILR